MDEHLDLDLEAIAADDALADLLAAGGDSALFAGGHDPVIRMLAQLRLAVELEDEAPVEMVDAPETYLALCEALAPVPDQYIRITHSIRKVAARGLAIGIVSVAALSVSSVAVAVAGDPLAPYETVIEKVVDQLRATGDFGDPRDAAGARRPPA